MTRDEFLSIAAPRLQEDWPDVAFKALFSIGRHLVKAGFSPGAMSAGTMHREQGTVGRYVRSTVRDPVLGEFDISVSLVLDWTRSARVVLAASRPDSATLTSNRTFTDVRDHAFAAMELGALSLDWPTLSVSLAHEPVTAWLADVFPDDFAQRFETVWASFGQTLELERAP